MTPLQAFWWSPRRDRGLAFREMRRSGRTWITMARLTRSPLINFGDELAPLVLRRVSGRPVAWASPGTAVVVSVGSVLEYVAKRGRAGATVWGSGLRAPVGDGDAQRIREHFGSVLAVRGPLTRDALGLDASVPLGDPGVFAADMASRPATRSGVLYLPHFRQWLTAEGRQHLHRVHALGHRVMPPAVPAPTMIEAIASADYVVSSSLHGLIVAHSLGVPAQWVAIAGSKDSEPAFKYRDYLTSVGSSMTVLSPDALGTPAGRQAREQRAAEVRDLKTSADGLASGLAEAWRAHDG